MDTIILCYNRKQGGYKLLQDTTFASSFKKLTASICFCLFRRTRKLYLNKKTYEHTKRNPALLMEEWSFHKDLPITFQRFSMGRRVWLYGGHSICENDVSEPLLHNGSLMNPGIVLVEYVLAIRKEEICWWNSMVIQVALISFLWHILF